LTSVIVDRRTQKGKSTANRQRLLKRLDGALKAQLGKMIARHKMQDSAQPAEVTIERKDATEPRLILDPSSGSSGRIIPGNDKYRIGDKIANSSSEGQGGGNGQGAGDGDSDDEDTFRFVLSRTEYLNLLFDDLELPALVKKDLLEIDENRFRRGGVARYGNPASVCVTRTFKASIGRRLAAEAQHAEDVAEAEAALIAARKTGNPVLLQVAERAFDEVSRHTGEIPFLDPVDLRHRSLVEVQSPCTAAVMFCLMDVSSSMDETRKDLAKRFFMLLHLFLTRKYKKVDLVFIRHTDAAQEVDEEMFFNGTQAGSTKVLSALAKMSEIITSRYPSSSYNIFGAQASDGDSFGGDSTESSEYLRTRLLPLSRYFVYAEVGSNPLQGTTSLWSAYRDIESERFNMASVNARNEVYPALAKLFQREP
jgi:uncharacterized sporulation protein YeaH/YhbH (DUF444 family)